MNIVVKEGYLSLERFNEVIKKFLKKTETVHFIFYSWEDFKTVKFDDTEKRLQIGMCSAFDKDGYVGKIFANSAFVNISLEELIKA